MRPSTHALVLAALLFASCTGGQTGDEGALRGSGTPHSNPDKDVDAGGKGVKGGGGNAVGCSTDLECAGFIDFYASMISSPIDNQRALVGSECLPASKGCNGRVFCACVYEQDTREEDAPTNFALGLGLNTPCDLYSRDGTCLLASDAFAGCDVGDASSCETACADALDAWARDDARTLDVKKRHASCALAEHECRVVMEVEGMCHPYRAVEGPVYDCALDDDAILARAFPPDGDAGAYAYDELGALPVCSGGDGCAQGEPYGGPSCHLDTCETKVGRSMSPCSKSGDPGETP